MSGPELLGGRYELRGILGRGGMAEVRDGWDTRLGRAVAIKLLRPGLSVDPESQRRFEAEARSAAALNHPNIVAVHDSGEHRGTPYIVMERLPGGTLADLIAHGPLPQPMVRTMLAEVLAALSVAHRGGILHRDIKPGNILFTDSGLAKVADFGIAKTAETNHTVAGQIVGTVAYLSPDRLAGKPASPNDDLYAVGVVGYEALTGRKAFPQDTLGSLAHAIMTQRPPALAALRPDVDPALAAVIERAMSPEAQWRFAGADAMRVTLVGSASVNRPARPAMPAARPPTLMMTSPVPPTPPVAGPALSRRSPPSRTRKLLALGAVLAAVVVAVVAFVDDSWSHPSAPPLQPAATTSATTTPVSTPTAATTPTVTTPSAVTIPPTPHGHGKKK